MFAGTPDDVVVVDTGNYYPRERDGRIEAIEAGWPESRWVAQQLGRPVIKAFNNIYARHLLEFGRPKGTAGRIALPVAGDDEAAKAIVLKLVDELGFDGVDAGGLDESWRQQPGTPVIPRTSTPRVCGVLCPRPTKNVLRNGAAPRTAPVVSPHPLERMAITSDNLPLSEPNRWRPSVQIPNREISAANCTVRRFPGHFPTVGGSGFGIAVNCNLGVLRQCAVVSSRLQTP